MQGHLDKARFITFLSPWRHILYSGFTWQNQLRIQLGSKITMDSKIKQNQIKIKFSDRDILAINLIHPKHRKKRVDGTHVPISFTKTNGRLRPTTPNVTTPQCNSTGTSISQRETKGRVKGLMGRKGRRIKHSLAWPPRISTQGNILHPTINPNQESLHKERISQYTGINEDLPYKERPSPPRNECELYATIKIPKPFQTKVRIIHNSSGILELWKFFNLTFGGYSAGTTPVLSARSSLFLFHRFSLEHVRTV